MSFAFEDLVVRNRISDIPHSAILSLVSYLFSSKSFPGCEFWIHASMQSLGIGNWDRLQYIVEALKIASNSLHQEEGHTFPTQETIPVLEPLYLDRLRSVEPKYLESLPSIKIATTAVNCTHVSYNGNETRFAAGFPRLLPEGWIEIPDRCQREKNLRIRSPKCLQVMAAWRLTNWSLRHGGADTPQQL